MKKNTSLVSVKQITNIIKDGKSAIVDQKVITDITAVINRYIETEKRPLYVYCHTTGKKCGMTAIAYFQKKLAQYGNDIVRLMTEYRGRGTGGSVTTAAGPRVNRKGNPFKIAASNNPFKTVGEWVTKTDKKGDPLVSRREVILKDGTKTLTDFDHATEQYTPVKKSKK